MKIVVFSDTHGNISKAHTIVSKMEKVDLLVHLGDVVADAQRLEKLTGVPCVWVKGNMDGAMKSEASRYILDTEYGKIWLTHGHCDGAGLEDYDRMAKKCRQLGCKAVFFGHTHVAFMDEIDGVRLMNPGSIARPRDGSSGTYGIVHIQKDRLDCSIMYLSSEGPKQKSRKGGFIRSLLNYSDRF